MSIKTNNDLISIYSVSFVIEAFGIHLAFELLNLTFRIIKKL